MEAQTQCPTPFDLVERVRQHLQNPLKPHHLDSFRRIFDSYRKDLEAHKQPDLKGIVKSFGFIFFAGALLDAEPRWDEDLLSGRRGSFGLTRVENGKLVIWVDPRPFDTRSRREQRLFRSEADSIYSTILHECCHGYLDSLGDLDNRCGRMACKATFIQQVGEHGHGDAFCRLAALVEAFAKEHNLWDCNLDLKTQAQTFLDQDGGVVNSETVRQCWPGLRMQRVGRDLEWY